MPKSAKKKRQTIGTGKPKVIEIEIIDGINIADEDSLREALQLLTDLKPKLQEIEKFQSIVKSHATTYMHSHALPVVQVDGSYWRKIVRTTRFWVAEDKDVPDSAPRSAKSLKSLCQGKVAKVGKKSIPLWQYITKRVIDPEKIDMAVQHGFLTEKEIGKAYLERDGNPFIQEFTGVALDAEDDA
jgi:hypothetical protein